MTKKNFILIACIIILAFSIKILKDNFEYKKYDPNFKIAVIQISSAKLKSYISFFDDNLNEISTMKINLGGLSQCWDFPKNITNKVYLNVKGTDLWPKSNIAEFNLNTGKYKLYNVKQKFNTCYTADNKNIYATNCDGNANIIKYELSSHSIKKLTIPNTYITQMKIYDDILYAFGNFLYPNDKAFLYVINKNSMKIIKSIDIIKCGISQYDSLKINDDIYFSNYTKIDKYKNEIENNTIGKYNLKTGQLDKIILQHTCPKQLLLYKNKLIISHEDWHQNGKYISIYNIATKKIKSVEIKNAPYQICLLNNKIYSIDRKKIYKYDIESFKLEKEFDLKTQKTYGKDFFISAFFINTPNLCD